MIISAKATKAGFDNVFSNGNFKCAYITYSADYSFGEVTTMKRHNLTDEIFVLLTGKAVMLTIEDNAFIETELQKSTAYNVKAGTWHYLAVTEDASVFVTENADTDSTNTDVLKLEKSYTIK